MKKEVELKFFVDDFVPVRRKLRLLGAKLEWKGREISWYFDTPGCFLKKNGRALRLRTTDHTFLTFKEKVRKGKYKSADEYQVGISDAAEMIRLLGRLGFPVLFSYTKGREYWHMGSADITLDTFQTYHIVEIEAAPKRIPKIARKLGLDFAKTSTKSYTQLLKE